MMQVRATSGKKKLERHLGPRFLPYKSRPRVGTTGHTVSAGASAAQPIEVISPMPMYHSATRKAAVESLMWMEDPENYVGVPKTNETPRHPEHPPLGPQVTFEAAALETNGIFLRACGQQQRHTDQTSGEQWRELESKFREALEHPLGSSGASQPNNPTGTSSVNMPMCITPTTSSTTLMMTLTEPWYLDWWCFAGDSVGSLPQRGGDDATPLGSAHHLSALDAHGLSRMTPGPSSTPYSNLLGNTWGY